MREPRVSFAGPFRARLRTAPGLAAAPLLALLAGLPGPALAQAERYEGRPLAEVLLALEQQGLAIVFTSELVRPEMTVAAEPGASDPRRVLDEVLAPHGLEAREKPGGLLVVVAKEDRGGPPPAPDDAVLARPFLHDEIVVFPSRLSLLHETPEAPFALSREEIESLPHLGGDLFRTMSLLPGTAANDVTAQFSVHGGRRDEVRIVLDGQELYDAFHLQDYDNALSIVAARSLAGATLTTGAYPASQGDRMSAVLDLRTIDPAAGRHYVLGLSVLDALASTSGRFAGGRGAWLATGRRGSLDLAGEVIGDEHPAFWDALAKAELETGLGRWSVHALVAEDELELDQVEEEGFERLENDYRRSYGWLTHQATPGDQLVVETVGSWAKIRRDRAGETREEEGRFELRDRRDLEVLALSQAWSLDLEARHFVRWGWEARRYDAAFDYAKDLEPEFVVIAPFAPPRTTVHRFDRTLESDHLGLWASDRLTLADRLTAELGVRYDRHTATDDTLLSPRVNLAWRLGERSVLRAAWGRFFQSQRPYELQVEDAETTLFRAERSEHWVLGYEALLVPGRSGLGAVRVELFRRDVEDPRPRYENLLEALNFFPEIEPDRVRIAPKRSTAQGVELLLRGGRGERFAWWLAYSYARSEDRLAGETVPRSLDQPHTVALDLDFRLPREWRLNLAWRYHTGWPTTPVEARFVPAAARLAGAQEDEEDPDEPNGPEEPEEPEPDLVAVFGRLNSERLPDYHRLDLRASRTWSLRAGRLTFFVDVQNLYDRQNLAGFDLALDEEAGTVELEEESWNGLFPSLGLLLEF
ncbi:MAG TPA: TonB-dependent receptor [Thermoanaerobaculia bacterium]|nr:TonB-dependent receptor [Thermoanaerobaculia bacterium]